MALRFPWVLGLLRCWRAAPALAVGAALASCGAAPKEGHVPQTLSVAALPTPTVDQIYRIADAWISSGKSVSVAIVIAQGPNVVYASGFGVQRLPNGAPVTAETPFRIGSVTKQFTAAAILRLAQQGRLSLDDRLSKYFPTFPGADKVTLRELLTHTSGIHNYTDVLNSNPLVGGPTLMKAHTTAQWVDHIARQRPLYDFPPGTAWHYTNSGYFLLGAIVEKISGQPLGAYLRDQFFAPLGMHETVVDDGSDTAPGRAVGYAHAPWSERWFVRPLQVSLTNAGGAGALWSSATDLVTWMQALMGGRVVDAASLQEMTTPARLSDGRLASANKVNIDPTDVGDYGFGLRIMSFDGHRRIGHDGDIPGFQAGLSTYPDDRITIAVVANTPGGADELEQRIAKVVLAANPPASGRPDQASAPVPRS